MPQTRKVGYHTLGCKLNFSETSTIARQFEAGGYSRSENPLRADIHIINTCSVTEQADKKCRNLIRKLVRENPSAIIAVTGCYAQLRAGEISAIEGVDLVLGNNDKESIYRKVVELSSKSETEIHSCSTEDLTSFFAAFSTGDRTRAFLKVQDGCDYKCSYCTIHNARGSSRNAPIAKLVEQAETIAADGRKEIVITGVNTGDFGRTTGESFIDLLKALLEVDGIERYRISSIEPNLITHEIIEFCARSPKFQHHFHVPLQSGSDSVLCAMRRRYKTTLFEERLTAIRGVMPDAFIGVDVLVGFPGESDKNFLETYEFLERVQPSYLHIFPYSRRPGTPAANLPGQITDTVKKSRAAQLSRLNDRLRRQFAENNVGRKTSVLFESSAKAGMMYGFTGNYLRVKHPLDRQLINKIVPFQLDSVDNNCEMTGTIQD